MDLVSYKDPILRQVMPQWDFDNPPTDPGQLSHDLGKKMLELRGLGLSAPQLGLPYRVFAIKTEPMIVMFNANIVDLSEKETTLDEGCLSLPGIYLKIPRSDRIRVRYWLPNGEVHTGKFEGLTARIIQHEYDHMDGIWHSDYVSKLSLVLAIRKAKKHGGKYFINDFVKKG